MRRLILITLFIAASIDTSFGQNECENIIKDFFGIYKDEGSESALDMLFSTNSWMVSRSQDDIENIKLQLSGVTNIAGAYFGYESITQKKVGESLKLYSYLVKYDRIPIRFTFTFYRPDNEWMIFNFQYDQNLMDELEEAAAAYRLKINLDY